MAAMMAGTYTGGGVNFVAMSEAFKASGELVSTATVADNLLMALFFCINSSSQYELLFKKILSSDNR